MAFQKHLNALNPTNQILHIKQKMIYWDKTLTHSLINKLEAIHKDMDRKKELLNILIKRTVHTGHERIDKFAKALHALNPKKVLNRGYCILFAEKDHSVITSIQAVKKNEDVRIVLSDGEALTTIKDVILK